jgi:hypothetical protein
MPDEPTTLNGDEAKANEFVRNFLVIYCEELEKRGMASDPFSSNRMMGEIFAVTLARMNLF